MLALIRFLSRLKEFTGYQDNWHGIVVTDSKSLLDAMFQEPVAASEPMSVPVLRDPQECDPLSPEWDLVGNILQSLQDHPDIRLQHIKGHQDRTASYRSLSLLAQLNIDADGMANRYQREYGQCSPNVLLTGTAGVHVVTATGTITSKYASKLCYQATHGKLLRYLKERYEWNDRVVAFINWKAHGASLRKHVKRKTHYIKMVHGILPTNRQLHRDNPTRRRCPACAREIEHWQHIMQCSAESRRGWRLETLEKMEAGVKKLGTRPILWTVLRDGINGWFNHDSLETVYRLDADAYTSDVRRLIGQQNKIGWQHIFMGRFSNEWSDLQDAFYARDPEDTKRKRRSGLRWQIRVISLLWTTSGSRRRPKPSPGRSKPRCDTAWARC